MTGLFPYLFVQELPGVLLDVSLVQVSGEIHEPHLWQAKIRQLNVTHRRDQQTVKDNRERLFRK